MANRIKYNSNYTNTDQHGLKTGRWIINTLSAGMGPTSSTDYYHTAHARNGFAIYSTSDDTNIDLRYVDSIDSLIAILQRMGCPYDNLTDSLSWARSQNILVADTNRPFGEKNTDGLVLYVDPSHTASFPTDRDGVTYNLNGTPKALNELRVLGFSQHDTARPFYNYFESVAASIDRTTSVTSLDPIEVRANYDLVVVDAYVWSFGSTVMQKIKDIVDAGTSVIAMGNDNRTNIFVQAYDGSVRGSHDIIVEDDAIVGLRGQTFTYGSSDVYGGIVTLRNGAVPIYRRADTGLITGFVYDNHQNGASLYFDQEGLGDANSELAQAGFNHALRNVGTRGFNQGVYQLGGISSGDVGASYNGNFAFGETGAHIDLSKTPLQSLNEDVTLICDVRQDTVGSAQPHQTVMATSIKYRQGLKLMSKYHDQGVSLWCGNNDGTGDYLLASGIDITSGNFTSYTGRAAHGHVRVAATRNASTGELKLYVNGQLVNSTTYVTGPISNEGIAAIGTDYHSSGYSLFGLVGACKAYDKVLSDSEILQEFYDSSVVTSPQPRLFTDLAHIRGSRINIDINFFDIASTEGFRDDNSLTGSDEHGGVVKLTGGHIFASNVGWYGKMSMSWWWKSDVDGQTGKFYTESKRGSSGCSRISSNMNADGTFTFSVWDNSSRSPLGTGSFSTKTTTNVNDGEWHQITCQWSNGTGNLPRGIYVYVDGELEGHTDLIGNDGAYEYIQLGGASGCVGEHNFYGELGPIIHYKNYNLSHEEVSQNYRAHAARFR